MGTFTFCGFLGNCAGLVMALEGHHFHIAVTIIVNISLVIMVNYKWVSPSIEQDLSPKYLPWEFFSKILGI